MWRVTDEGHADRILKGCHGIVGVVPLEEGDDRIVDGAAKVAQDRIGWLRSTALEYSRLVAPDAESGERNDDQQGRRERSCPPLPRTQR